MANNITNSRYPGARPFEKQQSPLFFGRDTDIKALYRLIKLRSVIALYGKSGTGKSSLLNAGIIPKVLEEGRFVPLVVRFKSFNKDGDANVMPFETTQQVVRGGNVSAHTFLDKLIRDEDSLWHDVKEHFLRYNGERGLLLIFDQFEELFTYDERAVQFFQEQLAEALYTDVPQRYWDALKREQDKGSDPLSIDELNLIQQAPQVKILISIRADRLHLLSRLDAYLPNILKNNYELDALDEKSATDAIVLPAALPNTEGVFSTPPFAFEPQAVTAILDFLTENKTEKIESTQLQIICNAIHNRVLADGLSLVKADDMGDLKGIIGNFYKENIEALPVDEQLPARLLIEDHLIFEEEERRLNLYEGKVLQLVSPQTLERLVDNHLLRAEPSMQGGYTYELSHDTLVAPVLQARAKRVKAEREAEEARLMTAHEQELAESKRMTAIERQKRQRSNIVAVLALLGLFGAAVAGCIAWQKSQDSSRKSIELADKNKQLEVTLLAKDEAMRQVTLKGDSLLTARQKEFESLNLISQKTREAQEATALAEVARQNANTYLNQAQTSAKEAEQATATAANSENLLKQKAQEAQKTFEELKAIKEEAERILKAKQQADARADKSEANYKEIAAALEKAKQDFDKANTDYKNSLSYLEKETADLRNATSILNAAREKERKVKKALDDKQAELNRANTALAAAQSREQGILKQYQAQYAQLQAANTQLGEAAQAQNQTLNRLFEKEKEVLAAYQAQTQAQREAQQARLDLEKKTQELEQFKTSLTAQQNVKPTTDVAALQAKEQELELTRKALAQAKLEMSSCDAKLKQLQTDLTEATKNNPQYAELVQNIETELKRAKQDLSRIQDTVQLREATIQQLKRDLADAKTGNQQNATTQQNKDAALRQKQQELDKAKNDLTAAQTNATKAQNELAAKQRDLDKCQGDLATALKTPVITPTATPSVSSGFEPQMVAVKGGTFQMGSNGSDNEKPIHPVTLSDFSICKFEVTVEQYMQFVNETKTHYPEWLEVGSNYNIKTGKDDHYKKLGDALQNPTNPIVGISWNDATAYCQWLSSKTGKTYRLPTEAEWEYAARGGSKSKGFTYSGSNTVGDVAWYSGNSGSETHAVGGKTANELGLHDMSGNVYEWCSDWYDENYYKNSAAQNPKGAQSGSARVLRGGSWSDVSGVCRTSYRDRLVPNLRDGLIGFRLARD